MDNKNEQKLNPVVNMLDFDEIVQLKMWWLDENVNHQLNVNFIAADLGALVSIQKQQPITMITSHYWKHDELCIESLAGKQTHQWGCSAYKLYTDDELVDLVRCL